MSSNLKKKTIFLVHTFLVLGKKINILFKIQEILCKLLLFVTRSGYAVAIVRLREAYKTIDDKIEELTNKIDTYPFRERYNNMMNTVNTKVDVS